MSRIIELHPRGKAMFNKMYAYFVYHLKIETLIHIFASCGDTEDLKFNGGKETVKITNMMLKFALSLLQMVIGKIKHIF
jgi:hypothetical protein